MKICIVIPLYNEKKHIPKVLYSLKNYGFPVIVVDDGSVRPAMDFIKTKGVTLLTHGVNLGKGASMKTGAEFAFKKNADAVVFMDADGQHDPHDLKGFISVLKSGEYDLVLGNRNLDFSAPAVRVIGSRMAAVIINLFFHIRVSDPLCGYRAITKKAYKKIRWEATGYSVEAEILARAARNNIPFKEIPIRTIYHDREKGVSILDSFGVFMEILKLWLSP